MIVKMMIIRQEETANNNIFGFDFINSIPRSISSTSDLPVPVDYVISLGDKLKIILTGSKNALFIVFRWDGWKYYFS